MFKDHAKGLATLIRERVRKDETLTTQECYWIPPYFTQILMPEFEEFKKKYPDREAFAKLVPEAAYQVGSGWAFCPDQDRDKDAFPWVLEVIPEAYEKLTPFVTASLESLVDYAKKEVLSETEGGVPIHAIDAMDAARVVLARQPDNEMAQKVAAKAQEWIKKYQEATAFNIEDMEMPEDLEPDDTALHEQMKAAYEKEAKKRGWNDQVLRVVVTSDFSEGAEAWWVGDTIHTGYFKKIHGAVAVKQAEGCSVMCCLFRQQMVDGKWGDMYLGKVVTSYPILEENINK